MGDNVTEHKEKKSKVNAVHNENKLKIRQDIISIANIFHDFCGKYVLYVFNKSSFIEVYYRSSSFAHLTGVQTHLTAIDFYKKARKNQITIQQFWFDKDHPYDLVKKKVMNLKKIKNFICNNVAVVTDLSTNTCTFRFSLSESDIALCLTPNYDKTTGELIDEYYIPASFRVGDIDEKSNKKFSVSHIFIKNTKSEKYSNITYSNQDSILELGNDIKEKLHSNLYKQCKQDTP